MSILPSSVVLVDEPELSLHPDWQSRITGFYKHLLTDESGNHPQIIFATHSPFIVHGANSSKIIILEKSKMTGKIRSMDDPAYPGVTADEAVRAFDLDSFLHDATQTNLLILTEGECDAKIIKLAWEKLHPQQRMPFELRAALGAKNINVTLGDDQIGNKMGERKLVGLFDFDEAFNQWKGLWKGRSVVIESSEACGLVRRHPAIGNILAMLLPVPVWRMSYASRDLAGSSILSIEFFFQDKDHLPGLILERPLAAGQALPQVNPSMKSAFAEHVKNLDASSFAAFVPLFNSLVAFLKA